MNSKTTLAVALLSTLSLLTSAHAQLTPSADAYTNSADPSANYGAATTLGVANTSTSIQTSYILLDLSSVPSGYACDGDPCDYRTKCGGCGTCRSKNTRTSLIESSAATIA